jgi:hypothetical protein
MPHCGHRIPADAPAELPLGDPVTGVPLDRAAIGQAHRTVAMAVEVLDQRRPADQLTDLVAPRVLRYLRAVPVEASGLRGGARLLSFHSRPSPIDHAETWAEEEPEESTPPVLLRSASSARMASRSWRRGSRVRSSRSSSSATPEDTPRT